MPHFLLVASTTIKSKRQTRAGDAFSGPARENLHQRRLIRSLQGTQPRTILACPLSFAGVRRRSSISEALSPGCGLPAPWAGALPARVRIAEAAVARNHLLHAHLEGSHAAILVHDPSADVRQRAPGALVGLAGTRI